jgi:hypothetical protein
MTALPPATASVAVRYCYENPRVPHPSRFPAKGGRRLPLILVGAL